MVPAMGMSEKSIEEYTSQMRARYARMTGRKARGKLLDEFVEVTGWERKHANKVLLGRRRRSWCAWTGRGLIMRGRMTPSIRRYGLCGSLLLHQRHACFNQLLADDIGVVLPCK